jgi:hypothetical protein
MLNLCPHCHLVTFGKYGWRYVNKYNRARLCVCCNHVIERYPVGKAPEWWLNTQRRLHAQWEAQRKREPVA